MLYRKVLSTSSILLFISFASTLSFNQFVSSLCYLPIRHFHSIPELCHSIPFFPLESLWMFKSWPILITLSLILTLHLTQYVIVLLYLLCFMEYILIAVFIIKFSWPVFLSLSKRTSLIAPSTKSSKHFPFNCFCFLFLFLFWNSCYEFWFYFQLLLIFYCKIKNLYDCMPIVY